MKTLSQQLQEKLNPQVSLAYYALINPITREWEFYLDDTGYAVVSINAVYPPIQPSTYALLWEKGRVLQELQVGYTSRGKRIFQSTQGSVDHHQRRSHSSLFPREWHRYQPDAELGWTEFGIGFGGDYANKLASKSFLSLLRLVLRVGHNDPLLQLLRRSR